MSWHDFTGVDEEALASSSAVRTSQRNDELGDAAERIVERANAFRGEEGLEALKVDGELRKAAERFAAFMAREDKYGHKADGRQPAERARAQGYDYCIIAENIAYQYRSTGYAAPELARRFATGWEESPEHRKNLLDADVLEIGVGVARSKETGYYYAVQLFGRPRSAAHELRIANRTKEPVHYRIGSDEFELPPHYVRTHHRCRRGAVTFLWSDDAKQEPKEIMPRDGDKFVIQRNEGRFVVERSNK